MASESDPYDYGTGCDGCDRVNVGNAVNAILALSSCSVSEPETVEEAIEFVTEAVRGKVDGVEEG